MEYCSGCLNSTYCSACEEGYFLNEKFSSCELPAQGSFGIYAVSVEGKLKFFECEPFCEECNESTRC